MENIKYQLEKVAEIVDGWNGQEHVSNLERDFVLEKLRAVYEQVLGRSTQKEPMLPPTGVTIGSEGRIVYDSEQKPVTEKQHEKTQDQESGSACAYAHDELAAAENERTHEEITSIKEVEVVENQPVEVVEECAGVVREVPVENTIERPEIERTFKKIDNSAIHSLYNDDYVGRVNSIAAPALNDETSAPELAIELEKTTLTQDVKVTENQRVLPDQAACEQTVPHEENGGNKARPRVLGEVLGVRNPVFGETVENPALRDVAARLANNTGSLRTMMGINDRFMLCRDLFSGDIAKCEEVIEKLDTFDDLNSALIYINKNFDWDPDCEGATALVDMLMRKLT